MVPSACEDQDNKVGAREDEDADVEARSTHSERALAVNVRAVATRSAAAHTALSSVTRGASLVIRALQVH